MRRLFAFAPALAVAVLCVAGTACAQQTVGNNTQQQAVSSTSTTARSDAGNLQQQGGSGTGRYAQSGMGYDGDEMGRGMMGGSRMGPGMMGGGMMGGMMGGGYSGGGYRGTPAPNRYGARENPGMALFAANCSSCHPHGGNTIYPNLPLKGAPQLANFKSFLAFLRNPSMPDGSRGPMPPFPTSAISDQQAHELYGFLVGAQQSGQPGSNGKPLSRDQVKRLVENYIHNTHNPNLKLGKITKAPGKDYYIATITTHSGSLVDKIEVNEYTGGFRSVYGR